MDFSAVTRHCSPGAERAERRVGEDRPAIRAIGLLHRELRREPMKKVRARQPCLGILRAHPEPPRAIPGPRGFPDRLEERLTSDALEAAGMAGDVPAPDVLDGAVQIGLQVDGIGGPPYRLTVGPVPQAGMGGLPRPN